MDTNELSAQKSIDEMALFAASTSSSAIEISSARSFLVEVKRASYRLATDEDVKAQYQRLALAYGARGQRPRAEIAKGSADQYAHRDCDSQLVRR